MEVSLACRSFIDCASRRDWRDAVFHLNGLNMYELLRSLKRWTQMTSPACERLLRGWGEP